MNFVLVVAVFAVVSSATSETCGRSNGPSEQPDLDSTGSINYIIGGSETYPHQYPWQVLQTYSPNRPLKHPLKARTCGGSIINDQWVVTAAHCHRSPILQNYRIIAGAHNVSELEAQEFEVEKVVIHPNWNETLGENDIALVKVSGRFNLDGDTVAPICLPSTPADTAYIKVARTCVTSGWGKIGETEDAPEVLLHASVPIVSSTICQIFNPMLDRSTQICAGDISAGAFEGDSGGPLACFYGGRYILAGVVSYGEPRFPIVYTRVSHFKDWIDNVVATQ